VTNEGCLAYLVVLSAVLRLGLLFICLLHLSFVWEHMVLMTYASLWQIAVPIICHFPA